uniref:DNA replication regulator SLD2 n=1 Tax=Caenorhabditis tropicalis TaxID=1561998 RepID=A0A1I7TKB5_9PELO
MDEWKSSFHEIYKRSPTADDISVAPNHIKALWQSAAKKTKPEEKSVKKGVKRNVLEMKMMENEQFSPVKKRVKLDNVDADQEVVGITLRTSPRKKITSFPFSPTKTIEENKILSPQKNSVRFQFDDFSPIKSYSESTSKPALKTALTPIKSPTKRPYQRQLLNRDLELLLQPTPEKSANDQEPEEEFDDETNEEVSKATVQKSASRRLGGPSKSDQNFQKINLRKKQFVRGKVTAEQKRKLKRKQMFRKKT